MYIIIVNITTYIGSVLGSCPIYGIKLIKTKQIFDIYFIDIHLHFASRQTSESEAKTFPCISRAAKVNIRIQIAMNRIEIQYMNTQIIHIIKYSNFSIEIRMFRLIDFKPKGAY